jgi:DEAD/DEAH box helicase domain-containing protein
MEEFDSFLKHLARHPEYVGQIENKRLLPARPATYGSSNHEMSPELRDLLGKAGIQYLYEHQAKAFDLAMQGSNVLSVSGTASGKSLCYNLPIMENILSNKKARALYLFPTKALAQDQLRSLLDFGFPGPVHTYDGDTPREQRSAIRRQASAILTNPDMLHCGIMPYHKQWATFFLNLKFVVIDEVHVLRGIFGSNVAQIIRRLRRVCRHYGSNPQFLMASATIANPREHAERVTGLEVDVITQDGAPHGQKTWIFWNPPFVDEEQSKRKSGNWETTWLLGELSKEHFRTIAFSKSRKTAEVVLNHTKRYLDDRPDIAERIASYRAGYLPAQRREIEARLFGGDLLGVSTTNALELGIDVGALDAAIMNGFPGTISSTWQQAGRAGRTVGESLAVLVAGDDPLDQYYVDHPEYFFGRNFEDAIIDLENKRILSKHLRCAAYEIPLKAGDENYFGSEFKAAVQNLVRTGELKERKDVFYLAVPGFPAAGTNIRSASQHIYEIVDEDTGQLLGTTEGSRAFFEIYPGAVYLHQGESYIVRKLDLNEKVAMVGKSTETYYTEPREQTDVTVLEEIERRKFGAVELSFGKVEVTTHIIAFQKKMLTGEIMGVEELDMPPTQFQTEAYWFIVPSSITGALKLDRNQIAGGIHAVEHAGIAMLPMFAMCDRWDIGGVSTPFHYHTGEATIFIYDGFEGGIGIAKRGFGVAEEHLRRTLEVVENCPCTDGCPSCIQSPKCGNWNNPLDKAAAIDIIKKILS